MSKRLALLATPVLSLLAIACGGSDEVGAGGGTSAPPDSAPKAGGQDLPTPVTEADRGMVAYLEGMEDIAAALRGVKDEASAQAAAKTIREVADRLTGKGAEMEALSDAELGAAAARYSSAMTAVQTELSQALMPVAMNPTYAKAVQDAMKELPTAPAK